MFALIATPMMTLIPNVAKAAASIEVTSVTDNEGTHSAPFDFTCQYGEITVSGNGSGTAPPGNIQQYGVAIDWGDGSATTTGLGTFTPNTGQGDFTFTFEGSHTYSAFGETDVTVILYHQNVNGNDNPAETTITLAPCDPDPDPSVTTDAADNISDTDATLHGTNGPVAATNSSYWVSLSPIDTSSSSIPSGVYSTPTQGAVGANAPLAGTALSIVTTSGIPGNLPGGIQPNTTYYFVAWVEVDGDWYPGENMTVTTDPDPNTPPACDLIDSTTFDPFALGSVNGQFGWSSTGPFDQEIVDNTYGYPTFGCKSLRISNAVTSGSFGDQTFSYSVPNEAGETIAENNGMSGGVRQERFDAEFDFASTDSEAYQPGLAVTVSPDRGDGARMSYLRFEDSAGGIDVYFYDVDNAADPANFNQTQIANDLPRDEAHTARIVIDFVDGPLQSSGDLANDIVTVYIDGVLVHTGTSWENYYRYDNESNPSLVDTSRTVDSLLFRVAGTAAPANDGKGFLFDNMSIETGPTPGPVVETSTVQVCKYADTYPENTPLSGWTLTLTGEHVEDLVVPTDSPLGVDSSVLSAGSYLASVSGTWTNQGGANPVDAEYSTTDGWATHMDGYDGYSTDILELQINQAFDPDSNWGAYNSLHEYAQSFLATTTGAANFRIYDGSGGVQNNDWFPDNDGTLDVSLAKGFAGITDEDGCVTFNDVPYGDYVFGEINQDGWTPVEEGSDLGDVVVDDETETFVAVNHNDEFGDDMCVLVSDMTTLEGGMPSDELTPPFHESWTAVVDALAEWVWGDPEIDDPEVEETQTFTKTFWLDDAPVVDGTLVIAADNGYTVELNGTWSSTDASEDNYTNAGKDTITIPAGEFVEGANTLVFTVTNFAKGDATKAENPGGLKYKLTVPGSECETTPPDQAQVKVHIYKYLRDQDNNIAPASVGSFPMTATWDAANIGAGSGNYALDSGNGYHAATTDMDQQADYSTAEVTDGSVVVPAHSESCPADKYRLVGYQTGDTLIEAENDAIDDDAPSFDSLDSDKYVIVVNEDCDELDLPPTEQVKVHIFKYLEDENDVATQIPDSAEIPPFDMSATWTAANLNGGSEASGNYVLGNNHGGTALTYAADTSPMDVGADYTTYEVTGENGVLPIGGSCVEGAYRLVGYKSGATLEEAESAEISDTAPAFTDLEADQYVIVVNEDCADEMNDEEGDEEYTITATAEGAGTISPAGSVSVVSGADQVFTFTGNGENLVDLIVDGVSVAVADPYTFTGVTADHTIHAVFQGEGSGGGGGGSSGSVLGAATDEPSGEACVPLLTTYMRMGMNNDAQEVMDLKGFLNTEMGLSLPVDSNFDEATDKAVRAFQMKYKSEVLDPWIPFGFTGASTGFVFKTTQWKVNSIHCAPTVYPFPSLP